MLDCHVIVSSDTPRAWVTQCLGSVEVAQAQAPFPVSLHVVPGVPGHIGRARATGYAQGSYPYVTCVDDDDYLLPHAFAALADALQERPDAIFTRELVVQNGKTMPGWQRHHLAAYRRDVLIDFEPWPCNDAMAQIRAVEHGRVVDITRPGYVHRLYGDSKARRLRAAMPHIARQLHG